MIDVDDENIPDYKPLSKRSKFVKPNSYGQVPKNCVHFNFCGKHCYNVALGDYEDVACDCKVLKGEYCDTFK